MIPTFPEFKHVEWGDREEFERYTKWMAPHSDFNFVSVWAWSFDETQEISILNDNLVIKYSGYTAEDCFFAFAGRNKINETALELIKFAKENYGKAELECVPEEVAKEITDARLVTKK